MKPTPAQIEAAARSIMKDLWPHPYDDVLWAKYCKTADAALTAAAEVGYIKAGDTRLNTVVGGPEVFGKPPPVHAAAEGAADKRANEGFADAIRSNAIAATIERCAQVADRFALVAQSAIQHPGCPSIREAIEEVAAAIRALKDGP